MSDGAGATPTDWDLLLLLRENIREAERRMESNVLMFGLLTALYAVIMSAATTEISAVGLTIADPRYAQFAIVPYGVLVAARYLKAEAVRGAVVDRHSQLLLRMPVVPVEAAPIDWSVSGDRRSIWWAAPRLPLSGTPGMMLVGVVVGYSVNFAQADGLHGWAFACLFVGVFLVWLLWGGRSVWRGSFYGPRWPDRGRRDSEGSDSDGT